MIPEDKLAEYDNLLEPIHSIENCFCNECCSCHIAPPCGHCVKCIDKDEHHDSVLEALQNTLNEIERLTEVLKFYAEGWHYRASADGDMELENGRKARDALGLPSLEDDVEFAPNDPEFQCLDLDELKTLRKQNQIMREALEKISKFYVDKHGMMGGHAKEIATDALKETGEVK
jgi:hypothetical protein